jgi:hypothetical protein
MFRTYEATTQEERGENETKNQASSVYTYDGDEKELEKDGPPLWQPIYIRTWCAVLRLQRSA